MSAVVGQNFETNLKKILDVSKKIERLAETYPTKTREILSGGGLFVKLENFKLRGVPCRRELVVVDESQRPPRGPFWRLPQWVANETPREYATRAVAYLAICVYKFDRGRHSNSTRTIEARRASAQKAARTRWEAEKKRKTKSEKLKAKTDLTAL